MQCRASMFRQAAEFSMSLSVNLTCALVPTDPANAHISKQETIRRRQSRLLYCVRLLTTIKDSGKK